MSSKSGKISVRVLVFGTLFVLGVVCVLQSEALSCYVCKFEEGPGYTQPDCEKDPPTHYLQTVPDPYGANANIASQDHNYGYNSSKVSFGAGEGGGAPVRIFGGERSREGFEPIRYPYCMKLKGERNEKDVVIRDFAWASIPQQDDDCQKLVPDSIDPAYRGLTEVKACYCNDENGCNGATLISLAIGPILLAIISFTL